MKIPLIKPYIDQNIKNKVLEVLDSGYLTEGTVTKEYEDKFADYIGCKHAIAVTSCTTGLEIALRAMGIDAGDEVIVPDYTYPATAAVAPIVGATSVIVDVNRETMHIDYNAVQSAITKKTKAIIPVSSFGNPIDYEKLNLIKEKFGLYIIEDAAPSVGAAYENKMVGNLADITVFSFHPRKFITTGEGGMITTNNKEWAEWMNSYKHFGMNISGAIHEGICFERIGTNYKLSNILAAIGLGQLNKIDSLLKKRKNLAENYLNLLSGTKEIEFPSTTINGKHSYQSFILFHKNRDTIMKRMHNNGIEVQIGTYALHMHKAFKYNPLVKIEGKMKNSKWCYEHALTLPLYNELTFKQQKFIVEKIKSL
ncbi:MAG: aminotransferase class I/II-fold pyridoxal phosphate-dependent enzyme [Candidatus Lokiarchaeota archaeon]|nr:aminotransferase class I/II-fold pyridoxal phosphate-dependent enzyme [Candidatus Lokiarchaeota archaeon]